MKIKPKCVDRKKYIYLDKKRRRREKTNQRMKEILENLSAKSIIHICMEYARRANVNWVFSRLQINK